MYLLEEPFIPEEAKNKMMNIFVGTKHKSFSQAALADFIDTFPVFGDISNAIRIIREPNQAARERQKLDFLLGSLPPPAGEIFDALTPTNIINLNSLPPLLPSISEFGKGRL